MFLTIARDAEYEQVIKKSRFICNLARINSEEDARSLIDKVKQHHRKATHHCFAYLVGDHDEVQRESDNGEPSGTAGVPILEALQMKHLHNVVAVVTRYFGGTKLGAGGLIRAYSNTTTGGVTAAGIVSRIQQQVLLIDCPYALHDQLTYYCQQHQLAIDHEDFAASVTMTVFVDQATADQQRQALTARFNNQLTIKDGPRRFREVPFHD
ncbi:YigZ family protein [uncultured Limosilactobacillus sp.]|uniref:YigZ family protein n=1 Tax=uncultured Limosilactobacillus sp. TaxID=2837629 RepID=UPI0025FC579D|nr:YigZ family protein [uncultured Limosilactobacillus sp.]